MGKPDLSLCPLCSLWRITVFRINVIILPPAGYNFATYSMYFAMNAAADDAHYKKACHRYRGDPRDCCLSRYLFVWRHQVAECRARINSAMYERIVNHKLRSGLEESLTVANAVSSKTLLERAGILLPD